ncbi:MAG TPA: cytochrome c3 family protein [Acidobacteriaceae bacterium]|nr:cytochrome c3 family protein [Acidobacteriaceae bacterium]
MAQVFDRSSNALARASLVLTGLIVIALGFTLDELQRSPWVTRQGQRADQPIPFSHEHHVEGLGIQCQYCHTTVEVSSYAGIPPTKTCINCHSQIWTNAPLLQPVRQSWATGASIPWIRIHDLPDYVYFNHSIHVNKGIGCASCHGRVDKMPLMYQENSLQMEWCLNCHRNPVENIRPTSEIYNMAWEGASRAHPVWCAPTGKAADGKVPTAENAVCTTTDPNPNGEGNPKEAALQIPQNPDAQAQSGTHMEPRSRIVAGVSATNGSPMIELPPLTYTKFTSQADLGRFLMAQYHIRTANELASCETCHR